MTEILTAYKVLNSEQKSATANFGLNPEAVLQYSINREWNKPIIKGSPLFLFATLESAVHFADYEKDKTNNDRIFLCEYIPFMKEKNRGRLLLSLGNTSRTRVYKWWNDLSWVTCESDKQIPSTVLAKKLRILEEIEYVKNY